MKQGGARDVTWVQPADHLGCINSSLEAQFTAPMCAAAMKDLLASNGPHHSCCFEPQGLHKASGQQCRVDQPPQNNAAQPEQHFPSALFT